MCTKTIVQKSAAPALESLRGTTSSHPKNNGERARRPSDVGSELQNRGISAPQETSLPRGSTRTQRCVPKRLMSSFPSHDKKRETPRAH